MVQNRVCDGLYNGVKGLVCNMGLDGGVEMMGCAMG